MDLTADKDYAWYRSDRFSRLAAERLLEIIGESLSVAVQVDSDLNESVPDIRKAIGLRNRIIRGYDKLDNLIIWATIRDNIPNLATELNALLSSTKPSK